MMCAVHAADVEARVPGRDRSRHRGGHRAVRRRGRPLRARRLRRRRAARRPRLPDRRVPHAVDEQAHRRVGRRARGPRPAADRDRSARSARASATSSRCGSASTRSSTTSPTARRFDEQLQRHRAGGRRRHRRRARHRVRQHRRRHRPDRWLRAARYTGSPGSLTSTPRRCARRCRRPGHHVRSLRARRGRAGARRRQGRLHRAWAASCSPIPTCRTSSPRAASTTSDRASTSTAASATSSSTSRCTASATRQTGREHDLAMWPSADRARRVLVIGGGPGGLEAARVLAGQRAHRHGVGGERRSSAACSRYAGRADQLLDRYKGWLIRQVEQAGVTLELGKRATVDDVRGVRRRRSRRRHRRDVGHARRSPEPTRARVHACPRSARGSRRRRRPSVRSRACSSAAARRAVDRPICAIKRGRNGQPSIEPTNVFCGELGLPGSVASRRRHREPNGVALVDSAPCRIDRAAGRCRVQVGDDRPNHRGRHRDRHLRRRTRHRGAARSCSAAGITARVVGDCHRRAPHRRRQPRRRRRRPR